MTDPDTPSSTTGPVFTIKASKPTSDGGSAATMTKEGPFGAATATETSPLGGISTPTTPIQTPTLSAAPVAGHTSHKGWVWGGKGLTVGAKAGIGAAAGASALFFVLALVLFWKRRRRFLDNGGAAGRRSSPDDEEQAAGKSDVELDGDSRGAVAVAVAVEAEAPVPRELPTASNDGDIEDYVKTPVSASALSPSSVDFDPCAPRYPSGPVEMPANEMVVAEIPDNSSPQR